MATATRQMDNTESLLARLDERTSALARSLDEIKSSQDRYGVALHSALDRHIEDDNVRFAKLFRYIYLATGGTVVVLWLIDKFIVK